MQLRKVIWKTDGMQDARENSGAFYTLKQRHRQIWVVYGPWSNWTSKAACALTFKQKEWMALHPSTWYSPLHVQVKFFHNHCGWSNLPQNVVWPNQVFGNWQW